MSRGKLLKFGFGILISVAFIFLIAASIPTDELLEALIAVRPGMIALAVGFFVTGYLCRIARWHLMLKMENPALPYHRAGIPFMISIAANNVMPLRAGDVMRAFLFSKWLSVPSSAVLATLVSERMLDLLMLLVFFALALLYLGISPETASGLLGVGSLGLAAITVFVLLVFCFPQVFQKPVMFLIGKGGSLLGSIGDKLTHAVDNIFLTMARVTRSGRTFLLVLTSVGAWASEALVFYASALAVPDITHPQAAWLAMPVGTLSTLLPSSPGYVGTFHYFVIQATEFMGNPAAAAAAFAIVVHLVLWITATAIGGICFVIWTILGIET